MAVSYTLVLTDANYIPNALYITAPSRKDSRPGPPEFFRHATLVADACITPNGNYALDISSTGAAIKPEPSAVSLLGVAWWAWRALAGWSLLEKQRMRRRAKGAAI